MQLVVGHRHAALGPRPGQADQVLRADVRGEDRGSHDQPPDMAAGQEVVRRGVLPLEDGPPSDGQQNAEVQPDDDPVHIPMSITFC